MTDWSFLLACDACKALQGKPCLDRSSGGPQALPQVEREVPHSGRKRGRKKETR